MHLALVDTMGESGAARDELRFRSGQTFRQAHLDLYRFEDDVETVDITAETEQALSLMFVLHLPAGLYSRRAAAVAIERYLQMFVRPQSLADGGRMALRITRLVYEHDPSVFAVSFRFTAQTTQFLL